MIFLDTSGLLCLLHAAELQHAQAVALYNAARFRLTHNYVLAEFVALATARGFPRRTTLEFVSDVGRSPEITVVYVDRVLHRAAMFLLESRLDKIWSLCDAVNFVVMQAHDLKDALTTDRHFEQAGLVRLLVA